MRRQNDVREFEQFLGNVRLVREDVEPRAQTPGHELGGERRLVHDLPACRVDDRSAVTQQRQAPRVEEPARLRRQRSMNGDEVRLGEQLVELSKLTEVRLRTCSLRIQNTQLESLSAPGDRLPDAAEPDDAERRSGELLRQEAVGPRAAPFATTNARVTFHDSPPYARIKATSDLRSPPRALPACWPRRCPVGEAPRSRAGRSPRRSWPPASTQARGPPAPARSRRAVPPRPAAPIRAREGVNLHVSQLVERRAGVPPRGENFQGTSLACRNEER
jgi:hypothetical protein